MKCSGAKIGVPQHGLHLINSQRHDEPRDASNTKTNENETVEAGTVRNEGITTLPEGVDMDVESLKKNMRDGNSEEKAEQQPV